METPPSSSPTPPSDVFIPPMSTIIIISRGLPPESVQPTTTTPQTRVPTPTPSTGIPSTTTPGSLLSTSAVTGIVLASIVAILMAVVVTSVAVVMKHSHSKQTAGEQYETPDAISMKENEAYITNTQTQHIGTAANEAYGCVGDIPVIENVAYTPAAVNIPTVKNQAYGKYEMESRDNTGDGEYAYVATSM